MTLPQIREKIERLVRLAERPGTPAEGENARQRAIELSLKYGVPCKFTQAAPKAAPKPKPKKSQIEIEDALMNKWVVALNDIGWRVTELASTKVGRQLRFRKLGRNSEVRVTQRKNSDGKDFEAEHIGNPDLGPDGKDWSITMYICLSLRDLMHHLGYTK